MKKSTLKFATVFAIVGAVLTLAIIVPATWDLPLDPHGGIAANSFGLWLLAHLLADRVAHTFGIMDGATRPQWIGLAVATNTIFFSLVGALIGILKRLIFDRATRKFENAA